MWREATTPITDDDLPRIAVVRPDGWAPIVSWSTLIGRKVELELRSRELGGLRGIPRGATARAPTAGADGFAGWDRADQAD